MQNKKLKIAGIMGIVAASLMLIMSFFNSLDTILSIASADVTSGFWVFTGFIFTTFLTVPTLVLNLVLPLSATGIIVWMLGFVWLAWSVCWLIGSIRVLKKSAESSDAIYQKKSSIFRNSIYAYIFAGAALLSVLIAIIIGVLDWTCIFLIIFAGLTIAYGVLVKKSITSLKINDGLDVESKKSVSNTKE